MRRIDNWYFSPDIRFPAMLDAVVPDPENPTEIELVSGRVRHRYRARFFPTTSPWYVRHRLLDFGPACPVYYMVQPPEIKTLSQFEYIHHLAQNTDASPLAFHHVWYFRYWRPDASTREFIVAHERFLQRDMDVNTAVRGQFIHDRRVLFDQSGFGEWTIDGAVVWRLEPDAADSQNIMLLAIDYRSGVVVNQSWRKNRAIDQLILRLARLGISAFGPALARFLPGSDPAMLEAQAPRLLARDDERRRREMARISGVRRQAAGADNPG